MAAVMTATRAALDRNARNTSSSADARTSAARNQQHSGNDQEHSAEARHANGFTEE